MYNRNMKERFSASFPDKNNKKPSSKWNILEDYDKAQRRLIDDYKIELKNGKRSQDDLSFSYENAQIIESSEEVRARLEQEKIEKTPTRMKKIGRALLDAVGIRLKRSQELRKREAMATALSEYDEEEKKRRLTEEAEERARQKKEREELEKDLVKGMDNHRETKKERIRRQRVQEYIEKKMNSQLTKLEEIEAASNDSESGVSKRSIEYDGSNIDVYDLDGYPFCGIAHAIDFKIIDGVVEDWKIGSRTAERLLRDPSLWTQPKEDAKKEEGYRSNGSNGRGNVISASFFNTETNRTDFIQRTTYGFSHIDSKSVIGIWDQDMATPNYYNDPEGTGVRSERDMDMPEILNKGRQRKGYNEILLHRYTRDGKAPNPDYIIARDGFISEDMKRHAAYFGIPIININSEKYLEKEEQRAREILSGINDDSDYIDVAKAIAQAKVNDEYEQLLASPVVIGKGTNENVKEKEGNSRLNEIRRVKTIEVEKRIDFICESLSEATTKIREATERGKRLTLRDDGRRFFSDEIKRFDITLYDIEGEKTKRSSDFLGEKWTHYFNPYNSIEVDINIKGLTDTIKTQIIDAERENPDYAKRYGSNAEQGDTSYYYDRVIAFARDYIAAIRENQNLKVAA